MKKYWVVFAKSLKSEITYRSAALAGIVSSLMSFAIQICLWKALLGAGVKNGTSFSDMLLFVVINSFLGALTRANVASTIENAMVDGSVSMEIIRPMSYKYYLLASILGKNFYSALTGTLPILFVSFFFISPASLPGPANAALFALSAVLGILLMFELTYVVGLLAFWIQRCWFLSWYLRGFQTIFGGTMVPLWFYPEWLKTASYFLPFRYFTFEPINFFLGRTPLQSAWIPLLAALMWLLGLGLLGQLMWKAAVRRLSVNGG